MPLFLGRQERIDRMGEPHIVAQGGPRVVQWTQTTALQLRHDQLDEVAQAARLDEHRSMNPSHALLAYQSSIMSATSTGLPFTMLPPIEGSTRS